MRTRKSSKTELISRSSNHSKKSQQTNNCPDLQKPLSVKSTATIFATNQHEIEHVIKIERTGRIMPQDQNSGGFYLALFRKGLAEVPVNLDVEPTKQEIEEAELEAAKIEEGGDEVLQEEKQVLPKEAISEPKNTNSQTQNSGKKDKKNSYQTTTDARYLPVPDHIWNEIKQDFGISDAFPRDLLCVGSEKNKTIYLLTPCVANYLKNDPKPSLKSVIFGTPVFQKSRAEANTPNSYRISQGGIRFVRPFMTKNLIHVSKEELSYFINCNGSVSNDEMFKQHSIDAKKFLSLPKNSYCLIYKPEGQPDEELFMVSKMEHSVVVMAPKEDVLGFKIKLKLE